MSDDFLWAQPQPRIIQHNKKRYALRLEQVFWSQLELLAARRRKRVGQIVADLADQFAGANFSSFLRAYIMTEMEREGIRYHLRAGASLDVVDVLRSCPAPGLLLREDRLILEVNTPLLQWIGGETSIPLRQQKFDTVFSVRVTRPLEETFALMRQGQLKRTQIQASYTPPTMLGIAPPPPRTALTTLTGYQVEDQFFCLVWLTVSAPMRFAQR